MSNTGNSPNVIVNINHYTTVKLKTLLLFSFSDKLVSKVKFHFLDSFILLSFFEESCCTLLLMLRLADLNLDDLLTSLTNIANLYKKVLPLKIKKAIDVFFKDYERF